MPFDTSETSLSLLHRELLADQTASRADQAAPMSAADTEATATPAIPATPGADQSVDAATVAAAKPSDLAPEALSLEGGVTPDLMA